MPQVPTPLGWLPWPAFGDFAAWQRAACAVIVGLVIGVLLSWSALPRQSADYVLVIDSGSTGTRIYAYTWRERASRLPLVQAVSIHVARHKVPRRAAGDKRVYERLETEPGLDRFVDDAEGVRERALAPLLEWAEAVVPRRQWARTPLFLFGTAGLRRLPAERQAVVLADVRRALHGSHFRFEDAWARVISGADEGVFGWIALNYLAGRLMAAKPAPHAIGGLSGSPLSALGPGVSAAAHVASAHGATSAEAIFSGGKGPDTPMDRAPGEVTAAEVDAAEAGWETLGALDLGGSSLEVTFMPLGRPSAEAEANVTIMGVRYPLFTHALLEVAHPCLHAGYGKPYLRMELEGAGPTPEPPRVRLVGRPDWEACAALAGGLVNASAGCAQPPCALGSPQPPSLGHFHALTGFFVVYHFFGLHASAGLDELEAAGRAHCAMDWASLLRVRGGETHMDHYCFRAPYVAALLRDGLGVPGERVTVGSGREAWTLGAALAEGGRSELAGRSLTQAPLDRRRLANAALCGTAAAGAAWLALTVLAGGCSQQVEAMSRKSSMEVPERCARSTAKGLGHAGALAQLGVTPAGPMLPRLSRSTSHGSGLLGLLGRAASGAIGAPVNAGAPNPRPIGTPTAEPVHGQPGLLEAGSALGEGRHEVFSLLSAKHAGGTPLNFTSVEAHCLNQAQLGLSYPNATPTFTLAYSDRAVAARTLPPQYAAALFAGVPRPNLTDATVYAPIKAAVTPLLAAAQVKAAKAGTAGSMLQYDPAGQALDGGNFSAFIMSAMLDAQVAGVRLVAGNYSVAPAPAVAFHLYVLCSINRTAPFTIDLGNSTLVLTDVDKGAIELDTCNNVQLRGPVNILHDPASALPFTQGVVTAVSSNFKRKIFTWTVEVQDGFPTDRLLTKTGKLAILYDARTRLLKLNTTDVYPVILSNGDNRTFSFWFPFELPNVAAGDAVVVTGVYQAGVFLWKCQDTIVSQVAMFGVGYHAFLEWYGVNNTYSRNVVGPYLGRVGKGTLSPLLGANGDGFRSVSALVGPNVLGNVFSGLGGDGISIFGTYAVIAAIDATNQRVTVAVPCAACAGGLSPGAEVRTYMPTEGFENCGNATLVAARAVPSPLPAKATSASVPTLDLSSATFLELQFATFGKYWSDLAVDGLLAAERNGDNYAVLGNVVLNARGRGLALGAAGLARGNTIVHPKFWGIQVSPDPYWGAAGLVGVSAAAPATLLDNNTVQAPFGGIAVTAFGQAVNLPPARYGKAAHVNITGNAIIDAAYAPLLVTSVRDAFVGNNTFTNAVCSGAPVVGNDFDWLAPPSATVYIDDANVAIRLSGNLFVRNKSCTVGTNISDPVKYGPNGGAEYNRFLYN
ncbi:hypothetical protein WJX81_006647 [Elliptochloris bilobata]|uniref:Apyrase n=1 Tax=Elliptochloris bilobata TaxID=381761 RepID=A0AAW1S2M9_9CHLO